MKLPPLSLYIHVPWCVRKCPYCDFNSHESRSDTLPESNYLKALLQDFSQELPFAQGRPLQSIFIGGGTPSLMSGGFYQDLLSTLRDQIEFATDIEVTLEANPGASEASRFEAYRDAGINRLSLGVQSFNDIALKRLGRIHDGAQALKAVEQLKNAGFDNFNIDLMHGLPEQTTKDALSDLQQAISLKPTHLSWYQLTIEQNTAFYSSPPALPNEDCLWDIQKEGMQCLAAAGFEQYEVSAYSKNGYQSRHNLNYWQFGDYLAIGAGAHGKVTSMEDGQITRYRKSRMPKDYLANRIHYRVGESEVRKEDLPFEYLMNVLRLKSGMSENHFSEVTGLPLSALQPNLEQLRHMKLVSANRLQLSDKGYLFLNEVVERFIVES